MWDSGFKSSRNILRVARYATGKLNQTLTLLAIIRLRAHQIKDQYEPLQSWSKCRGWSGLGYLILIRNYA
jgi:hypothetical protein